MPKQRRILKVLKSQPTIEGAGVHLKRAFGFHQVPLFDPFLLLDDFHSSITEEYIAGFPKHPHRGIETVTYILEGLVAHGDSMGNKGVIGAGDVQWMTAGSGIIHEEMPQESPTGTMWGFQLWVNLPAESKMMPPRYREVLASTIPEVKTSEGVMVKVIAGTFDGVEGPVRDIIAEPTFIDVTMPPDSELTIPATVGHGAFAYVLLGEGMFDDGGAPYASDSVVLFQPDGDEIHITCNSKGLRFLLVCGKPLGEPVAWYGPIVMNTSDELQLAFKEYQEGTFIKSN